MTTPEEHIVRFEARGSLPQEYVDLLASCMAHNAMTETVELRVIDPQEDIPTAEELADKFDASYLTPIEIEGVSTYAVTKVGMYKFFSGTDINSRQVKSAWENLARHSKTLHDPFKESRRYDNPYKYLSCSCELQPYFDAEQIDHPPGRVANLLGINPNNLATILPYMDSLYTGFRSRFRPQTIGTISKFIEGITLKNTDDNI